MLTRIEVAMPQLEVLAVGTPETLNRSCVDCGRVTGRFCDYCYAKDRIPDEKWEEGQMTPLCSVCDNKFGACHFCRGLKWSVPPPFDTLAPQPAGWGSKLPEDVEQFEEKAVKEMKGTAEGKG